MHWGGCRLLGCLHPALGSGFGPAVLRSLYNILLFLVGAVQGETWVTCQHGFHCVHHQSQLQYSSEAEMKQIWQAQQLSQVINV